MHPLRSVEPPQENVFENAFFGPMLLIMDPMSIFRYEASTYSIPRYEALLVRFTKVAADNIRVLSSHLTQNK